MRQEKMTTRYLAVKNLQKKRQQTLAVVMLIAIFAASVFGGGIFSKSMKSGLTSTQERLGADIILVPEEAKEDMETILLQGNTSYFYMSKDILQKLEGIEGIEQKSYQYFFASAGSACCDMPVEIIGFDTKTDFVISPWIQTKLQNGIEDGYLVVGSDISVSNGHSIQIYGQSYEVAAQMGQTGTGMDQTVFVNMNTLMAIRQAALKEGFQFLSGNEEEIQNQLSAVFINVSDGYEISEVVTQIKEQIGGIDIVLSNDIVHSVAHNIAVYAMLIKYMVIVLVLMVMMALILFFSLELSKRKKEIALLRMIGMRKIKIVSMLIMEAILQGGAGTVLGMLTASILVFPFQVFIADALGQPYVGLGITSILLYAMETLILVVGISILAVCVAIVPIYQKETYQTIREGE